jgi:hypothetical protein
VTEIRLASCLSPNGHHISTAKHGGYDLYSLDTGIVLHTFAHGLHAGIGKYPTAFLPGGFAFCGATIDGTVTIWGLKEGDRLQSVQHICAFRFSTSPATILLIFHKRTRPYTPSQYVPWLRAYLASFSGLTPIGTCCKECWRCTPRNSIFIRSQSLVCHI